MGERLRKAVHNLTDAEVGDLRRAHAEIQSIRDNRSYEQAAGYHGIPNNWCWHHPPNAGSNDQRGRDGRGPLALFLPWHRAYLYDFEMRLRDRVESVTMPWWDWTHDAGIPKAYDVATLSDSSANPLFSVFIDQPRANPPTRHWTQRDPNPDTSQLPSASDLDTLWQTGDFLDFSARLEDIHDSVHGWVGMDMGNIGTAAFDPIFWAHHCMIDRVWRIWQERHGVGNIPTGLLDEVLDPFRFRVREVLDVGDLQYDYVASAASSVASSSSTDGG